MIHANFLSLFYLCFRSDIKQFLIISKEIECGSQIFNKYFEKRKKRK